MPRQKGQPKVPGSGRKPGTPNRTTAQRQEVIARIIDEYQASGKMMKDLDALEPKDRLIIIEKLTQYILPKRQAVDGNMSISNNTDSLSDKLAQLAQENDN